MKDHAGKMFADYFITKIVSSFSFSILLFSVQARREGAEPDTDESWSSPDSSDEEEGGPDHVQCMSS